MAAHRCRNCCESDLPRVSKAKTGGSYQRHISRSEHNSHAGGRSGIGISIGATTALVGVLVLSFFTADDDTLTSAVSSVQTCGFTILVMRLSPLKTILAKHAAPLSLAMAGSLGIHFCFSGGWMQPGCMNVGVLCCAMLAANSNRTHLPKHSQKLIEACSAIVWIIPWPFSGS